VGTEPLDGVAADDGVVAVPPAHTRRHLAADALTALLALALLAVLQSVDVIIVGSEAPRRSGAYAAISVASKAIVFGALTLSGYLVPEAAARWHRGENAFRQLGAALALVALPAAALVGMALVDAHRLLAVVFGERLAGAAPALATL